jgi:putative PIN family toxin of toxin-antitoxin system
MVRRAAYLIWRTQATSRSYTSLDLLAELTDVLERDKFARKLNAVHSTARELVLGYGELANLVHPASIPRIVKDDPDDDIVLACALAANAEAIVSGDSHLKDLKSYQSISILTANELLERFE